MNIIPKKKIDKVSLFIVGAQKAGTSALHNYLIKHSNIQGGIKKELNFFNHQNLFNKGVLWYHKQFQPVFFYKPKPIYIDSTPQYLNETGIAEKIYNYNSKAKIVILLREPVSRAFSAWNMYSQFSELNQKEKEKLLEKNISTDNDEKFRKLVNLKPFPSFDVFVERELNNNLEDEVYPNIIRRGLYADQVKAYIDLFGFENVLVFESNHFKKNKIEVTNKVLKTLGLSCLDIEKSQLKAVHSRSYENQISKSTGEMLREFYKPHNASLFELINQKFDW